MYISIWQFKDYITKILQLYERLRTERGYSKAVQWKTGLESAHETSRRPLARSGPKRSSKTLWRYSCKGVAFWAWRSTKIPSNEDALDWCFQLALAIQQAAQLIKNPNIGGTTIESTYELFKEHKKSLPPRPTGDRSDIFHALDSLWNVTFKNLTRNARALLSVLSLLSPGKFCIPSTIITLLKPEQTGFWFISSCQNIKKL